ncbi:MAG: chorismate-binding protein [Beutenbergiaceae bacterium]
MHARAWFRGVRAHEVVDYADLRHDRDALSRGGWWVVVAHYDGPMHAWRFADVRATRTVIDDPGDWLGPAPHRWATSMDRLQYHDAVMQVRAAIADGEVYQANICRVLRADLPAHGGMPDAASLAARLATGNPAPYAALIEIPEQSQVPGAWVVSASPELSLEVAGGLVRSGPIKGTARTASGLTAKDRAENVMITDLVRNDLQRICEPGSVEVTQLLAVEHHPGLVHLVSRVQGRLRQLDWHQVLCAAHPPGSVSGAPKSSAMRLIGRLEPVDRGPYCGQIGWVDADTGRARLAVGIRTFWWSADALRFGTGAGITWGSDPGAEWAETELKAARLVALASPSI